MAPPEGLSGKSQHKGPDEHVQQDAAEASGPPEWSPSELFPIVGVGPAAGGLEDFASFLKTLPADIRMGFVLVQHMDPARESLLNRLLAKETTTPVSQVKDGMSVEGDCVYVIPPDTQMTIHEGRFRLVARPGGETRHTPVDEELQCRNKKLQTAQVAMPSAKEERPTLNQQLPDRNLELAQTANDLTGVLNVVEIPILILGNDCRIRRFSSAAGKLLNLSPTDIGRSIGQIRRNMDLSDFADLTSEVVKNNLPVEREVRDKGGNWYAFRVWPHSSEEHGTEAILTVVDITQVKRSSTSVLENMRGSLLILDFQFRVASANRAFCEKFHFKREEVENRILFELGRGQWNIPGLRDQLEKVLPEKKEVVDFEVERDFPGVGHKILLMNARRLYQAGIGPQKILLVLEDITERKAAEEKIHQLLARLTTAREDEGKRIARELHDTLGPRLALLNLKVSEVAGMVSSNPNLVKELEVIRNEISSAAKVAHDLSHELHPAALSQLGLAAALEAECANFSKLCGTAINFSRESVPASLPDAVALCLYRVALTSLENIRQHAQAKTASIKLAAKGTEMGMVIQDFGRGFDLHAAQRGCGLGLVSMEERVRLVNGKLSVNSKPGEGTRVEVRIPVGRI